MLFILKLLNLKDYKHSSGLNYLIFLFSEGSNDTLKAKMKRSRSPLFNLRNLIKQYIIVFLMLIAITGCRNEHSKSGYNKKVDSLKTSIDSTIQDVNNQPDTQKRSTAPVPEINEEAMQRAVINKSDSSFTVYNNIRADYRIIGYQLPDTSSKKMVLFSVFTADVENNPGRCPYGSYYGSPGKEDLEIKYIGDQGNFVKAFINNAKGESATIYFPKKWVEFE